MEAVRPGGGFQDRHQAQEGQGAHGLAGPGLPDEPERFALVEGIGDVFDGVHAARIGLETNAEMLDGEQLHARPRSFGSSASRSPSPKTFSASSVEPMAAAGHRTSHQKLLIGFETQCGQGWLVVR